MVDFGIVPNRIPAIGFTIEESHKELLTSYWWLVVAYFTVLFIAQIIRDYSNYHSEDIQNTRAEARSAQTSAGNTVRTSRNYDKHGEFGQASSFQLRFVLDIVIPLGIAGWALFSSLT